MKVVFNFIPVRVLALGAGLVGCGTDEVDPPSTIVNAFDVPIDGLTGDDIARFDDGDALFGLPFRAPDGLGPLFIRTACASCHVEGTRGPGLVQKMIVVEADGMTPAVDQSALAYGHTIRQGLAAGAMTPIVPPTGTMVKVSLRIGPPVLGRGYLEAIADAEIERVAAEQAASGGPIQGRINRVAFASEPNPDVTFGSYHKGQLVIGRFGVKSRIAAVDDFTADAYQGDMGMTTPMRPIELANPDGLTDDMRPGVDLAIDHVDRVAFYLRRIAIPKRVGLTSEGRALFEAAQCSSCHVPSLRTRADYPIAQLAGIDAPVFTDLLLHDMGAELADGITDGTATARDWRTAPLIGLRFLTSYLHDGRAQSVADAILAHDGEARDAADAFRGLTQAEQDRLITFVEAL